MFLKSESNRKYKEMFGEDFPMCYFMSASDEELETMADECVENETRAEDWFAVDISEDVKY